MGATAQNTARVLAAGRVVVGVGLVASPGLAGSWIGEAAQTAGGRVAIRALGARDAALGVGTLAAAANPRQLRPWLIVSSLCDAVDFAATLSGPDSPARSAVLALAAGAAAAGLGLAGAI